MYTSVGQKNSKGEQGRSRLDGNQWFGFEDVNCEMTLGLQVERTCRHQNMREWVQGATQGWSTTSNSSRLSSLPAPSWDIRWTLLIVFAMPFPRNKYPYVLFSTFAPSG